MGNPIKEDMKDKIKTSAISQKDRDKINEEDNIEKMDIKETDESNKGTENKKYKRYKGKRIYDNQYH